MNSAWEEEIEKFVGGNFTFRTKQIELYKEALTHSSYGLPNNQRLAFLGDSVLRLIIREHCFIENFKQDTGDLTKKCQELERSANLAKAASNLDLVKHMRFGGNYNSRPDEAEIVKIKGEALEALFGAIHLDQGFYKTKEIVRKLKII